MWNTGGIQLGYTGKHGLSYMLDESFRAYLSARLLLPVNIKNVTCTKHNDSPVAPVFLNEHFLHGLSSCTADTRLAATTHSMILKDIMYFVGKVCERTVTGTVVDGNQVRKMEVKSGADFPLDYVDGSTGVVSKVYPDFAIVFDGDGNRSHRKLFDLTVRIPHKGVFCDKVRTKKVSIGQGASKGVGDKERQYRDAGEPVFALALETNGYVHDEMQEFLSFMVKMGAQHDEILLLKKKISGKLATQVGNSLSLCDRTALVPDGVPVIGDRFAHIV